MEKAREAFRTISEVAEDLDIPQHVLRFWESRFAQIKPMKRGGGRRYYRPEDVALLRGIRHLLYGQGYTIRGVQRILRERGIRYVQAVWEAQAEQPGPVHEYVGPAEGAEEAEEAAAGDTALGRLHSSLPEIDRDPPLPRNERREPTFAPAPQAAAQARPTGAESPDRRQALRSALAELAECRRVLDAALDDIV